MSMSAHQLVLRLLSGTHRGAEIPLTAGEYLIGCSEQCDIVLADDAIAPRHAKLAIGESGLILTPLAEPLWVAGQAVAHSPMAIGRLQLITVGSTNLSVGFAAEDWSQLDRPAVTAQNSPATPAAAAGLSALAQLLGLPVLTRLTSGLRPQRLYSLGAAVLLLSCVLVVVGTANTKPVRQARDLNMPLAQAHRIVERLGLPNITVEPDQRGIITISGYVDDHAQALQVKKALSPLGAKASTNIKVDSDLVEMASGMLREMNITTLRVSGVKAGVVKVDGYINQLETWNSFHDTLRQDVAGIQSVNYEDIETLDQRLQALQALLAEKGLSKKLKIIVGDGTLTVSGAVNPEGLKLWKNVERTYKKRYGGQPALRAQINQAPDLNLAIRGVSIGAAPFVVTKEGNKYMEGSTLGGGYIISAILPDRIVLLRNNQETVYYLGGK